jgi:hypothetical protein
VLLKEIAALREENVRLKNELSHDSCTGYIDGFEGGDARIIFNDEYVLYVPKVLLNKSFDGQKIELRQSTAVWTKEDIDRIRQTDNELNGLFAEREKSEH